MKRGRATEETLSLLLPALQRTALSTLSDRDLVGWMRGAEHIVATVPDDRPRIAVAAAVGTFPWRRLTSRDLPHALRRAVRGFERVVCLLMDCSVPIARAAVEAVMGMLHVAPRGGAIVAHVAEDVLIRALHRLALSQPAAVATILAEVVAPMLPRRRWVVAEHHVAAMRVLLVLALEHQLPEGNQATTQTSSSIGRGTIGVEESLAGGYDGRAAADAAAVPRSASIAGNNKMLGSHQRQLLRMVFSHLLQLEREVAAEGGATMADALIRSYDVAVRHLRDDAERLVAIRERGRPPWWKDVLWLHAEVCTDLRRPLRLHRLAPAVAVLCGSAEVVSLLHASVSAALKGQVDRRPLATAPSTPNAKNVHATKMPAPPTPPPLTVEQRICAAVHIAPLCEAVWNEAPQDVFEDVTRRMAKWVTSELSHTASPLSALVDVVGAQVVALAVAQGRSVEGLLPAEFCASLRERVGGGGASSKLGLTIDTLAKAGLLMGPPLSPMLTPKQGACIASLPMLSS